MKLDSALRAVATALYPTRLDCRVRKSRTCCSLGLTWLMLQSEQYFNQAVIYVQYCLRVPSRWFSLDSNMSISGSPHLNLSSSKMVGSRDHSVLLLCDSLLALSASVFSFPGMWEIEGAIHSTKISGPRFENFVWTNGSRQRPVSFQSSLNVSQNG